MKSDDKQQAHNETPKLCAEKPAKPATRPAKESPVGKPPDNAHTEPHHIKPLDIPAGVKTRYGRVIRPPLKFTPEDRPLDDTNDEDDSSSDIFSNEELAIPKGENDSESDSDDESEDDDAGSLKDFIVGDDEIDSSESDDEDTGDLSDEYESDQDTSDDSETESQKDDEDSYLQDY